LPFCCGEHKPTNQDERDLFALFFELSLLLEYQKQIGGLLPTAFGWYFSGSEFHLYMAGVQENKTTIERLCYLDITNNDKCLTVLRIFSKIRLYGRNLYDTVSTMTPPQSPDAHVSETEGKETSEVKEKEYPKNGLQHDSPQNTFSLNSITKLCESSRNKIYLVSVRYPNGKDKCVIKKFYEKDYFVSEEAYLRDLRHVQGVVQMRNELTPFLLELGLKNFIPLEYSGIPYDCPASDFELCYFIHNLFKILDNCHKIGFVHCDIKKQNVLFDKAKMKVTVIDWEFARWFNINHINTKFICMDGTKGYQAPEVVQCRDCCSKVDVWSAGILFLNLMLGTHIKNWQKALKIMERDTKQIIEDYPNSLFVSVEGIELARALLKYLPKDRPSFGDVINYPYFSPLARQN